MQTIDSINPSTHEITATFSFFPEKMPKASKDPGNEWIDQKVAL